MAGVQSEVPNFSGSLGIGLGLEFFVYILKGNFLPSSPILVTLMMDALNSSETSVLIGAIR
jgi:hypothetical protein